MIRSGLQDTLSFFEKDSSIWVHLVVRKIPSKVRTVELNKPILLCWGEENTTGPKTNLVSERWQTEARLSRSGCDNFLQLDFPCTIIRTDSSHLSRLLSLNLWDWVIFTAQNGSLKAIIHSFCKAKKLLGKTERPAPFNGQLTLCCTCTHPSAYYFYI